MPPQEGIDPPSRGSDCPTGGDPPSETNAPPQKDESPTVGQVVHARHLATSEFSGPLPPPEIFRGYEEVLPGSADRILKMAELEPQHRHCLQEQELRSVPRLVTQGQVFGFLIGMTGVLGGIVLVLYGNDLTGFGTFFTSLAALAGIYIYGTRRQKAETSGAQAQEAAQPDVPETDRDSV